MSLYSDYVNNPLRIKIGEFLSKNIYTSELITIDVWSFVHLFSGIGLMFLMLRSKIKTCQRYLIILSILIGFEVLEFFLYTNFTTLFIKENASNVMWDIIIGLIGAWLSDMTYHKLFK